MLRAHPVATSLLLLAGAVAAQPAIQVTNYANGEVLRYPVPVLRGTIADVTAKAVTVINTSSSWPTREMTGLAEQGRFIALTELVPGENKLLIRVGQAEQSLSLTFRPQTHRYVARVVYFTDNTGNTAFQTPFPNDAQDFRGKLDTAMKLLQSFTAESMNEQNFGRRTFNLELDAAGKVKVHVLQGDDPAAKYQALDGNGLYGRLYDELHRKLPHPTATNLVIPAFTRRDAERDLTLAHTALGGGDMALFGGGDLFTWPDSLADVQRVFMDATPVDPVHFVDDSVGRKTIWANASTTMGAALHELGHTFGLPHSTHPHDIMTRGHDRLNRFFTLTEPPHAGRAEPYAFGPDEVACWAPVSAGALAPSRYFAMDDRDFRDAGEMEVTLDPAARVLRVASSNGIGYVGLYREIFKEGTLACSWYPLPNGPPWPQRLDMPLLSLGKRIGTPDFRLHLLDSDGNGTDVSMAELLSGPYVQAWRFAATTTPWDRHSAFTPMDDRALEALQASAAAAELRRSDSRYVDFSRLAPGERRENVAAYALRTIVCEAPRAVSLLTGSDDALRVWVNGKLVLDVLKMRSPSPDAETTPVQLRAGENQMLVEVSNGGGGWGLYLRLEDEAGNPLELSDDGRLLPVDTTRTQEARRLLLGPFVRRWQISPTPRPWRDKRAFISLTAADLTAIEGEAAAAPLAGQDGGPPTVDFLPHFPADKRTDVAGYALRVLKAERPMKVRIFTGSDDALRMWLNGRLITEVLALRGARTDAESTVAQLDAGRNRLLVEVSNAGGDWGLVLRIEDEQGRDVIVEEDGTLNIP